MAKKPPTQGVGVAGFKADIYASDEIKIRWHDLIHIPKFQMYAVEMTGATYGNCGNVMEWISGYVQDRVHAVGEQGLFGEYCKWHDDKGYWKQEDFYGKLLGEV